MQPLTAVSSRLESVPVPHAARPSWQSLCSVWFAAIRLGEHGPLPLDPRNISSPLPENTEAFEGFFRQFEPRISGYLWHLTDEQTAYDLSQETFLRAWQHFSEISTHPTAAAWLFRVATNLALGHLRRRQYQVGNATPLLDETMSNLVDTQTQVAERDHILQTLAMLPPKQRAMLVLREIYGFSTPEASQLLGISPVAAKRLLTRAYHRFRQCYRRTEEQR